jgi:hypothetical protein
MKFKQLQKSFVFFNKKKFLLKEFLFQTKDEEIHKYQKRLNDLQINIDQLESQVC